jgi:hypothetical protein
MTGNTLDGQYKGKGHGIGVNNSTRQHEEATTVETTETTEPARTSYGRYPTP